MRFHSRYDCFERHLLTFSAASKDKEEEEYDSAADEDFSADEEDEESLGDADTDIEEEEVNDLEAYINMPTARKKSVTPKKAGSKTDDAISALSGQVGKLNISKVKYVILD